MRVSESIKVADEAARNTDRYVAEALKLEFSVALERQRKKAGLTYSSIADRIKSSLAYVSKVFRGESNLTIETMVKLARATGGRVSISVVDAAMAQHRWDIGGNFVRFQIPVTERVSTPPSTTIVTDGFGDEPERMAA